jgi:hypothetical protein
LSRIVLGIAAKKVSKKSEVKECLESTSMAVSLLSVPQTRPIPQQLENNLSQSSLEKGLEIEVHSLPLFRYI